MGAERAGPARWPWIYAAAWVAYFLFYVTALAASGVAAGLAVRNGLANTLPDALLGLLVLRVARRMPWPEERRAGFFLAHLAACALYVAAAAAGWLALWGLDRGLFDGVWSTRFDLRLLPWRMLTGVLIYGALAGFAYAWRQTVARRELAERAARADALRARAELDALRRQLDPHFVLNTLHAVLGLVRRRPEEAEDALERLGDLLRRSLGVERRGADEIALAEEWELVSGYLDLARLRLGDRLRVESDLDPAALDLAVPSFALQTLVENAVRHGIAPRAGGGRLSIRAHHGDGTLRLVVENEAPVAAADDGHVAGIGLRLLAERLAVLYGGAGRLATGAAGGGFRAELELPAREVAK